MPSYSPDYHTTKNYLDFLLSLPWGKKDKLDNDLKKAENILNRDHYGLNEVKERILDFLAVYLNDFHSVEQRSGNHRHIVSCSNKHYI